MHFPKLTLGAGRFRCLGCQLSFGMDCADGQMTINVAELVSQPLAQLLYIQVHQPAMGTLIIPVFNDGQRCVVRSYDMILLAYWGI